MNCKFVSPLAFLAIITLFSCTTPPDNAEPLAQEKDSTLTPEQIREQIKTQQVSTATTSTPSELSSNITKNASSTTLNLTAQNAQSSKTVTKAPQMPGISVSKVNIPDKWVALTFDDGPSKTLTPQLLDILDRTDAKVTFFCQGQNVKRYPDIVKRAAAAGHEIASHSWDHPNLAKCSDEKINQQLTDTANIIQQTIGKAPTLLRPPYGSLKGAQRTRVHDKFGYHIIFWEVDPLDWKRPGSAIVAQRLINGARPGYIMLSHDIHEGTIHAIQSVISNLEAQGYKFVTVSQLINRAQEVAQAQETAQNS